jgi:hypothetical protein
LNVKGKYIYGITDAMEEKEYPIKGIGNNGNLVHSLVYKDTSALVSDTPVKEYPVSRENTLIHMKIIENFMEEKTVLPVKFGTVALGNDSRSSGERIKKEVLKARYSEIKDLLDRLQDKVELGLKAMWTNMDLVYQEIITENKDIQKLKQKISSKGVNQSYKERIRLGTLVKNTLDEKRTAEEKNIIRALNKLYCELRFNKTFGDKMITNTSFLVEKKIMKDFDKKMKNLDSAYKGRIQFSYIGPIPPCNFVELVIELKEDKGGIN